MLKVDRGEFWGSDGPDGQTVLNPESYAERPQRLNYNVVISAPKLHAPAGIANAAAAVATVAKAI